MEENKCKIGINEGVTTEWQEQSLEVIRYMMKFGAKNIFHLSGNGIGFYYINQDGNIIYEREVDTFYQSAITYSAFKELIKERKPEIINDYSIF